MLQLGAADQVFEELEQGQHDGGEENDPGQRDAQVQVLLGNEKDDGRHQHQPVAQTDHAIKRQAPDLLAGARSRLRGLDAQQEALAQVLELVARALEQIGCIEPVHQHVVAVKAHERIEVEQQGRDAGYEDHVVGQGIDHAGCGMGPDQGRHCRHRKLRQHPRGANQQAVQAAAKAPAGRRIHIGQRRKHQEHHAHLVDLAAIALAGRGMAKFVHQLGQHQPHIEQAQIARCEQAGRLIKQPVRFVHQCLDAQHQQHQVTQGADRAEDEANQRHGPIEGAVRIDQGHLDGQKAHQQGFDLAATTLPVALEQTGCGRASVKLQQVRQVQLAEQLHHLLLRQGQLRLGFDQLNPHLVNGAVGAEPTEESVGVGGDAEKIATQAVAQHHPLLAPKALTMRPHAAAQAGTHAGHAVPAVAVGPAAGVVGAHSQKNSRRKRTVRCVMTQIRGRWPASMRAVPPMPGRHQAAMPCSTRPRAR